MTLRGNGPESLSRRHQGQDCHDGVATHARIAAREVVSLESGRSFGYDCGLKSDNWEMSVARRLKMIHSVRCHVASCRRVFPGSIKPVTLVLWMAWVHVGGQPAFAATMTCRPSSTTAFPSTSVTLDVFLENASDVRGYQAAIRITRLSGSGELTVRCPDGVAVSQSRPDYIFAGLDTTTLTPGCANCGVIVTHCGQRRVAASRVSGGIDVGGQPAYLATFQLDVSADAAPGSTYAVEILPYSE